MRRLVLLVLDVCQAEVSSLMSPVCGPKGQGEGAAAKGPQAMVDQHLYLTPQDIADAYVACHR